MGLQLRSIGQLGGLQAQWHDFDRLIAAAESVTELHCSGWLLNGWAWREQLGMCWPWFTISGFPGMRFAEMGQPSLRNLTNFSSTGVKSALQALHAEQRAVLT